MRRQALVKLPQAAVHVTTTTTTTILLFLVVLPLVLNTSCQALISEECRQETETLLNTEVLEFALEGLLKEYQDDYDQTCDFDLTPGSTNVGCRLKFSGDNNNATYTELCNEKGGKIYLRDVFLKCGVSIATYEHDLGQVPICIGTSCNTTQIQAGDINEPLMDDFVTSLSFTGCKGAISAAATATATTFTTPTATSSSWRGFALYVALLLLSFVGGNHLF